MILFIDTTQNDLIEIRLEDDGITVVKKSFAAPRAQAEKLLPAINRLLTGKKVAGSSIEKIRIASSGGSFTSLRIGVVTANALAYALGIPIEDERGRQIRIDNIELVEPNYARAPEITLKKKRFD